MDAWIAGGVFAVAYGLIAIERLDRTIVALMGGLLMIAVGVVDQATAFAAIDLNVIFLLIGMMILGSTLGSTGFFEWVAIRSLRLSRGHPLRLLLVVAAFTALASAFLDNVTTVVLTTPVVLSIAHRLRISPKPYLLATIMASNIGGTATLIGDPPNILIGSASGLDFMAFLVNLGPVTMLVLMAALAIMGIEVRRTLQIPSSQREEALEATEPNTITDRATLIKTLAVMSLVIAGFVLHSVIHVEPATVAMLGATAILLLTGVEPHRALRDVEWTTLFFFIGLFVMVEGIVHVGIVDAIARAIADAAAGNVAVASLSLLWFSAGASAVIDNIPFTATVIPVVERLADSGMAAQPLWWSLALGACLGGNLTIVGASANVVVANAAARSGNPIGFGEFLRYGALIVLASLVISTAYVWARYLA